MTRDKAGQMLVSVSCVGVTLTWLATLGFILWRTEGGPMVVSDWAMLFGAISASWSVIIGQQRHVREASESLSRAYDMGREAEVRRIRT